MRQPATNDVERKLQALGEDLKASPRFASLADDPRADLSSIPQVHVTARRLTWYEKAWSYVAEAGESVGNFFSRASGSNYSSGANPSPNYDFANAVAVARERIRMEKQAPPAESYIYDPRSLRLNKWDQRVARGLHTPFEMTMQTATDLGGGARQIGNGNLLDGAIQFGSGLLGMVPFGRALGGLRGATLNTSSAASFGTPAWSVSKNGAYGQNFGARALEADFGLSTGYTTGSTTLFGAGVRGANTTLPAGPININPLNPGTRFYVGANGEILDANTYARNSGFRTGVRDQAWADAVNKETGLVSDPLSGLVMKKAEPWDMGHRPGMEYWKERDYAIKDWLDNRNFTTRQGFLDKMNDPSRYRPELPSSNRSHRAEDVSNDFWK